MATMCVWREATGGLLCQGQNISYPGDPLQDFTLIRFLDRFVYRNPKKQETSEYHRIQYNSTC